MERSHSNYTAAKIRSWWACIVSIVKQLYDLTRLLYETVQRPQAQLEERDRQIEEITKLLDKREQLMGQLAPPFQEEEKHLGQEIIRLNKEIDQKLKDILNMIKMDMKQLKVKKEKANKYSNPYESLAIDGMFIDKRN